ncbi:PAX-interacting protein 1 [Homalodisca vitripennis]|nr:PAX-interacting protein 1 [Homalodisca vitripennis]
MKFFKRNRVENILQKGGAEGFSYFSDYVTHCIVGSDPVDTDISDATDLYEVPAVSQEWVIYSHKCGKLLPTSAFRGGERLLFTGVVASFSKLSQEDCKKLWAMLRYYGGSYNSTFTKSTTHLIVSKPEGHKYEQALKCSDIIHVVTPDWLFDSVRTFSMCAEILYHPRLLIIEKPQLKTDYQSTAHITGFADDVVPDENSNGVVPSSEILQQLKLRMPWNQPTQTVSSVSSTQGPLSSVNSTIQKQVFSGSQMGLPHPRPVSSVLQPGRPILPQQQLLQQRAIQQQRLLHQSGMQQWRPQTQKGTFASDMLHSNVKMSCGLSGRRNIYCLELAADKRHRVVLPCRSRLLVFLKCTPHTFNFKSLLNPSAHRPPLTTRIYLNDFFAHVMISRTIRIIQTK